jgi:hypothetical protein
MNALLATELLLKLLVQAQAIGGVIAKAQAEGRDVTAAELDTLKAADDAAKAKLDSMIAQG